MAAKERKPKTGEMKNQTIRGKRGNIFWSFSIFSFSWEVKQHSAVSTRLEQVKSFLCNLT